MDNVYWLARVFGPYYFIIGLWMLLRENDVQTMWDSVKTSPACVYIGAALKLLIGLTILSTYRAWDFGIAILLTIIGYLTVLHAILMLFVPKRILEWDENLMAYKKPLAYLSLIIGILLSSLAFFE